MALAQRIGRKDQDQEILCLETHATRKSYDDRGHVKRNSNGESFSVIKHRDLDRKRITKAVVMGEYITPHEHVAFSFKHNGQILFLNKFLYAR